MHKYILIDGKQILRSKIAVQQQPFVFTLKCTNWVFTRPLVTLHNFTPMVVNYVTGSAKRGLKAYPKSQIWPIISPQVLKAITFILHQVKVLC